MLRTGSAGRNEKEEMYALLQKQAGALLQGESDAVANLANLAALLYLTLQDVNWAGFYLARGSELVLGPFQGKPACVRIAFGKGVCGTAAREDRVQIVPDVHAFAGHIACDSGSRSEIVVPLHAQGRVAGVMDIDSPTPARFDETDAQGLGALAKLLESACFRSGSAASEGQA